MTKRGRPKGSTKKADWVSLSTYISPEAYEYLDEMKKRGYIKARVVDRAILADKDKFGGGEK